MWVWEDGREEIKIFSFIIALIRVNEYNHIYNYTHENNHNRNITLLRNHIKYRRQKQTKMWKMFLKDSAEAHKLNLKKYHLQ